RVVEGEEDEPEDAAVAGHAAFPDLEPIERVLEHIAPTVEENPAEPPTEHHAEDRRPGDEIRHLIRVHLIEPPLGERTVHPVAEKEAKDVREAVPPQADAVRELNDERVVVVQKIGKHARASAI